MQTCTNCDSLSPDQLRYCTNCGEDLEIFSTTSVALSKFQQNSRVMYVRVAVFDNCCPACRQAEGAYPKEAAPKLPVEGCSTQNGCRCFYQPFLEDL